MADQVFNNKSTFTKDVEFLKDVYIYGKLYYDFSGDDISFNSVNTGNLYVSGISTFIGDATFLSLDVGVGGTVFTADVYSENVGIATASPVQRLQVLSGDNSVVVTEVGSLGIGNTDPLEKVQILSGDNSVVVTGLGTVGIGTTNPLTFNNDGDIGLHVNGSVSIQGEIYDSRNLKGGLGNFLSKDANGITWVSFEPSFTEGVFLMDEGVYVPIPGDGGVVGAGQSFTILNFVQSNSLGLGTDTLIPTARNSGTPTGLATIFTKDLWGYSGSGDSAAIYRMTQVGINNSSPAYDLDITGTLHATSNVKFDAGLDVDGATTLNNTLDVDLATTLNSTLDVDSETTLNSTLDVDGATTLNSTLDVDGATTLNNTLDVDGATTLNSTLDVDGATTLNSTLDVDGLATFNDATNATSINDASVQIDGGVGIVKKLFVGEETKIESDLDATSKDVGALVVEGGVGIEKKLFVGGNTKIDGSLELDNTLIDINGSVAAGKTDYRLSSVGSGVSWRPAGVQTKNIIYVTKNGDDTNSGLLEGDAKATIGGACAAAQDGDTIYVRPGTYFENNPIGLRTDVSITGQDIRLVTVVPNNQTEDLFHVRRGCLIENMNFAGNNVNTSYPGAMVAFPPTGAAVQNSGYIAAGPANEGPSGRWRSPYVRNCTNFATDSIGMKIDGNHADANFTGTNNLGQDLKSMVVDAYTQYNQNGIGVSITNRGYAQLVSIFTINCEIAIFCTSGGQCDLTNSNSSFGIFGLFADGTSDDEYFGETNASNAAENDEFVITDTRDSVGNFRKPFDGQGAYFEINLNDYVDTGTKTGIVTEPLRTIREIRVTDGGSGYSEFSPPQVIVNAPLGPEGVIAELAANVSSAGTITSIDVISSGRNFLPEGSGNNQQTIDISFSGSGGATAEALTDPILYTVDRATTPTTDTGISTVFFNEFIPYAIGAGVSIGFRRLSRIITSSHSFEYVGAGTDINKANPFQGGEPVPENEIVAINGGQVPFTSTDQKGNFRIGDGLTIDQTTSTIRGRDFNRAIQANLTPLILALGG